MKNAINKTIEIISFHHAHVIYEVAVVENTHLSIILT